ncbi:MAG: phosphoribosylformylglycinamidine cyclo-ligase [Elusimicrobia bacterium RIFCSPLOWO2_01_FULL_60_11]|nr:MAG: phosphoribosylformylglycinamidine cyclo-ligase [Elusimicrobia bacterium RIFCSPLOWO2_01_FULL_60_11]
MNLTYQEAGVDIDAGNELVRRIKRMTAGSKAKASAIGGFSGLFPMPKSAGQSFLSGCCDGVGTKLKIAFLLDKHDTVGIDLVAMNVNDLICVGAKPLFFLDYFACGSLDVGTAEKVIQGIFNGCEEAGAALLGGETAEMPGFYKDGEYDLAGFAVGWAPKKSVLDGKKVKAGDVLLGLPSSGFHSNGYSLVRKVFSEPEIRALGSELIAPTKIYVKPVLAALSKPSLKGAIKSIAHITGGGWYENIPRVLPRGFGVRVRKGSWPVPDIFRKLQVKGSVAEKEMYRTFNMGIGLVMVADKAKADRVKKEFAECHILGEIEKGMEGVVVQ